MKKIDVRGLNCPEPVFLTKKAIDEGNSEVEILCDAVVARENISRLAGKTGYSFDYTTNADGDFVISLKRH